MVEYKCNKCNKIFNKKDNYNIHINRKYPCNNSSRIEPKNSHKLADPATNVPIENSIYLERDITNSNDNISNTINTANTIQCSYCNKTFTLKSSLARHLNSRCTVKKDDTNKKEEIFQILLKQMKDMEEQNTKILNELRSENLKQQNQINELKKEISKKSSINIDKQNNTVINNTNNQLNNIKQLNINVIAHGKEDLSFITQEQMKKILNKGFKSIENFIQIVHFDKNRPENHNIYISNIKDSYVMKYDGDDWKLMNRENCLQDLYDDKGDYLVEKFEELQGKLDESTLKRFGNFLSKKDDDKIIEQTKREIKLILYNNRKIPEETRKLLKLGDDDMIEY